MAVYVDCWQEQTEQWTRPLLSAILAESTQLEELLDAYGAANSSRWFLFREYVSALRNFASVGCKLLHLRHAFPRYHLLAVDGDFLKETETAMGHIAELIKCAFSRFGRCAAAEGLDTQESIPQPDELRETLPPGMLPRDRKTRHEASASERLVHLATSLLDLGADAEFLHTVAETPREEFASLISDPISEESMRQLEYRFHNLQSLYDTYVSDSDTEATDSSLWVYRGHVSVIFHLMEIATVLVHFYERHHSLLSTVPSLQSECPFELGRLLDVLMTYCIGGVSRYLTSARELCHSMLKRYATVSTVAVPVPRHKGFHVRPSALVARIVQHYGSEVTMELGGDVYDASSTLELFRANEHINEMKRRRVADEVVRLHLDAEEPTAERLRQAVHRVILELAGGNVIAIYEMPLPIEDEIAKTRDCTVSEVVLSALYRLLAMGKIDVLADVTVQFKGDDRVLKDIALLAEGGYCEDNFGNNTPLPPELSYLKRT